MGDNVKKTKNYFKGRSLSKICFCQFGVKRKLFESDKKLRNRTMDSINRQNTTEV